jgi:hypothetical protein
MNKRYRFEIVRRGFGRFGWIFVRIDDRGRRRVLAASQRSYRSRKGVCNAILALEGASVVDTTEGVPFALPATGFTLLEKQTPLMVPESADAERVIGREVNCEDVVEDDEQATFVEAERAGARRQAAPAAVAAPGKPAAKRQPRRSTTRRTAT